MLKPSLLAVLPLLGAAVQAVPTFDPPANATHNGTLPSARDNACLRVSKLYAAATADSPDVKPLIPAEIAYDCLHELPFNQTAASDLMDSMKPYLEWQTTISFLKDPPEQYAEKVQPPHDFWAIFDAIKDKVAKGLYQSEYAFGIDLYHMFQQSHDGHFGYTPDSVGVLFNFGRPTALVSVSEDGQSLPAIYAYADVLAASFGNASFTPSPIVKIDGQHVEDFLLDWSQVGTLQDKDALWNNLFYSNPQTSMGPDGTATGSFSGGGRGRLNYPGPTTTFNFANGTSSTVKNFAKVLVDFTDITSGADVWDAFFAVDDSAYDNPLMILNTPPSNDTANSTSPDPIKPTPAPGYPAPVVRHSRNLNGGYFLDTPGFEDVAVLTVLSFVGDETSEVEFQNVNSEFIAAALAANKTKLIIDVSANGGGTILQGYDLFKQLFPSILPYGGNRFRAHEAFDVLGQEFSEFASHYPRSLSVDPDIADGVLSSPLNYRTDADVNYEPFTSWAEKFGPDTYGPGPDDFTSIIRWNLSDVLTRYNSLGIDISGYTNRTNVTVQPFEAENIIVVYDGYCASTCTIFSEMMRQQAGVKTIALGGRPNHDEIQAVGGVKGVNDYPWSYILSLVVSAFNHTDSKHQQELLHTALGKYNELPFYRTGGTPYANVRDGFRQGDKTNTPLQFVYEPSDCRIFYTPAMVVDQSAVWRTVADTVWGDADACVAGSNDFYGNKTKRNAGVKGRVQNIRKDIDVEAIWKGLDVQTAEKPALRGDGIMLP